MNNDTQAASNEIRLDFAGKPAMPIGKSSPVVSADASAKLHLELLDLATRDLPEPELRGQIRLLGIKYARAIGVGHLIRDSEGNWDLKPEHSSGRVPRRHDFLVSLGEKCDQVAQAKSIRIDPLNELAGCFGVFAPIENSGPIAELLLLVVADETDSRAPIWVAEKLAATLRASIRSLSARQQDWKVNSLSAIIDLVSRIENCETIREAMLLVTNELSRYLGIPHVAIAQTRDEGLRRLAISGANEIDRRSEQYHSIEQCLQESLIREEAGLFPAARDENDSLLLAHRQLASQLQCESIYSQPIADVEGNRFGAWIFCGPRESIESERLHRFLNAISPRIVNALLAVQRSELPSWIRVAKSMPRQLGKRKVQLILLGLGICIAILFLPVPYRIRCNCTVEPELRRFAVAPFEGAILQGFARAGDQVEKDQVLAEMDGRALRYEMAEVSAEHRIAVKQRAIELAENDIPNMLLAELDGKRLEAEEKLLEYKQNHLKIKSPIAGVILTGSLERAEAAGVKTGDVLFEIGSLNQAHIQIEVPAEDVSQISVGHEVTVWIDGFESDPLKAKLERIRPQSELRGSKNVFIAEFTLPDSAAFRPGMTGSARIDGNVHPLGWNLFHKPYDFLRSRLSW